MESFIQEKTFTTPKIQFNIETFEFVIEGECRPENVLTYFTPIINWLNKFKTWANNQTEAVKPNLNFHFKLEYYNSSSAKFLFNIFEKLKSFHEENIQVKMHWYYDEMDEDLLESGKEFQKILGMKFEFIALKED